tara:strand:- start:144 stop:323 length:180 start_codon:yes stop_codon:yes gene_type:complete
LLDIAKPAASSLAELIRNPVDSRSIVDVIIRSLRTVELAAIFAAMLVLIVAILTSPSYQ